MRHVCHASNATALKLLSSHRIQVRRYVGLKIERMMAVDVVFKSKLSKKEFLIDNHNYVPIHFPPPLSLAPYIHINLKKFPFRSVECKKWPCCPIDFRFTCTHNLLLTLS